MSSPKPIFEDKVVWQSAVFANLVMNELMLKHLRSRYPIVKSWKRMMHDLESYLIRRPDKIPRKDWPKFVFNCAARHADDVRTGKRFPNGDPNPKAFTSRQAPSVREGRSSEPVTLGEIFDRIQQHKPKEDDSGQQR